MCKHAGEGFSSLAEHSHRLKSLIIKHRRGLIVFLSVILLARKERNRQGLWFLVPLLFEVKWDFLLVVAMMTDHNEKCCLH